MIRLREDAPKIMGELIDNDSDRRCSGDVLRVGGENSPGICKISKAATIYTWDKRKAYGYAGAWLIFTGDDLSEFDVEWTFWTDRHARAWDDWKKKFLKPPSKVSNTGGLSAQVGAEGQGAVFTFPTRPQPPALGVYNPILAELGINKIVCTRIGQYEQKSIGKFTKIVSFYHWNPPVLSIGKPSTAIPDAQQNNVPAKTAEEIEIARLQAVNDSKQQFIARGYKGPPPKVRGP